MIQRNKARMALAVVGAMVASSDAAVSAAQPQDKQPAEPLVSAGGAAAKPDLPPATMTAVPLPTRSPDDSPFSLKITPYGSHTFRADLDDSPGDVAITRAGLDVNFGFRMGDQTRVSLGVDSEWSGYDFDKATGLVPGTSDPLGDAYTVSVSPTIAYAIDEQWTIFGGPSIRCSWESGADIGDSFTYGGFVGARYAFSDSFALSFGVSGTSRLEDDFLALPLIGFEWKINERVTFAAEGLGVRLSAAMNDEFTVGGTLTWFVREYRLDDSGPLPDGVARDSRVPIGAYVQYSPSPNVSITLTGGVTVWQEFEFFDDTGNDVGEDNTDPAPFIGLMGSIRF